MKTASMKKYIAVALSFAGSAILLFSCDAEKPAQETTDKEHMLTEYSEDMSIVMTEDVSHTTSRLRSSRDTILPATHIANSARE